MCKKSLLMMLLLALLVPLAANAQTSLWSEDFEDGTMPEGWTTDGSGTWTVGTGDYSSSTGAGNGSYNAKITHGTTGNVTKLITPEIDLSSVSSAELSFMHVQRSWSGDIDQLRVYYRTSSSGSWNQLVAYTGAIASWTTESGIVLPDLSSTYQLAFEHTDKYGYGVGVDNIVIVQGAACPKPAGLAATLNGQSVTLTWASDATSFSVAYSMDATATPADNIVATVNSATYTMNDLTLDEDHYFWVRANCSGTEQSDWSDPVSVHVGYCTPAPTSVDGNGISNVTFGIGENVVNNDTPKATYADYSNLVGAVQAGNEATIAITFQTGYTYNTFVWVDLNNSLSFEADEVVCYGESTSNNPTTLTLNFTIPATQTLGDFRLRIGSADSGLGSNPAAANPCYSSSYGCFQDYTLRVLAAPTCLLPTGLTVSHIEARQAVLSWTQNGEATAWDIDVNGTVTTISQNPYTLVGLEPDTEYRVKVRANCGGGDYSEWTSAVTFTTDVTCHTPTALTVSDITAFTANVNWTGTETTHQLRYVANPPMFFQGFVTDPGAMSDGSDASWLKEGETTYGPGVQKTSSNWLADDFVVNTATALTEIEVYSYQTGSTTESTYTGLYAVIYDGNPADSTTNIVWGDMETNIMTSTAFTNCYRGENNDPTGMTRPIMAITASNLNIDLEPGTYWLVYTLTGTLPSGPWGVPYCEPIIGMTGNGMQHTGSSNTWQALENNGKTYGPAMKLMFAEGGIEAFDWTYVNNIEANTYALANLEPETNYLLQVRATCGGDDGNSEWATTTFTTLPTCLTPTALTVSDIEARQVVLSWTENGDATAWDVEVTGEYTTTWNATTNPYTLVGLEPSTRYTVKVRAKCSDTDFSEWSTEVVFTTDLSCYPPTHLTVSDITATAATLGWTSTNDNFDVWYRPLGAGAALEYNFDEGMSGWTNIDADGDGYDWVLGSECGGVYLVEGGSLAGTGHESSADMVTSGSYSNFTGGALTPDNYLVSPQITLGGSISFWACAQDASYAAEHFGVAVSTTGNTDAADFTTIQEWTMTAKGVRTGSNIRNVAEYANNNQVRGGNRDQGTWYEFTVDLSEYSGQGYVAIRHFDCTDMFILNVDDIAITLPGDVTYEWVEVSNATNPYTITGLDPETTYEAQVRSNCGAEDGVSTWVHTTFTTLDVCNTPDNLTAIDSLMTAYTATLNWNGIQNSYNLRYGVQGELTAFFREDFAEGIPADWTNDATYPWTVTDGYIQSSNAGVSSSTSAISATATFESAGTIEFDAECRGEGTSSAWDKCIFEIDGVAQFTYGAHVTNDGWLHYSFEVAAGSHTFTWKYTKDSSVNPTGDYFAIDNVVMSSAPINWAPTIEGITEVPYTLTGLERTTQYYAQVQGVCPSGLTEWSNMVSFTTTVSCWQPTQLVVTDVTPDNAVIAWTANGEETAWDIEVSDLSQTPAAVTNWTAITENPFTLPGLFEQTDYSVRVRANCGSVDGESEWSEVVSFTTLGYCDMPEDLEIGDITFYTATASWTGIQEGYNLKYWKHEVDPIFSANFRNGIPADFTNDATYPWTVVNGYIQSSNAGVASSTSAISITATYDEDGVVEFDAECRGEGSSSVYDKCIFEIDGVAQFTYGAHVTNDGWLHYSFEVAAGEHTFTWKYTKDSSVNPTGDYFAIDNVVLGYPVEPEYIIVENIQDTAYIFTELEYEATYFVQVQGMDAGCTAGTEWTDAVSFFFPMPTQTIALTAGWNWVSIGIAVEDPVEMLDMLKASLGENATEIQSVDYTTEFDGEEWFGDLDEEGVYNEQMYIIYVENDCTIELTGMPAVADEYEITIYPGWNWIGFPSAVAIDVIDALSDFDAAEEDEIQDVDFTTEFDGEDWFGDLETFEPGRGLLYNNTTDETKTLIFRTGAKKAARHAIPNLGTKKQIAPRVMFIGEAKSTDGNRTK